MRAASVLLFAVGMLVWTTPGTGQTETAGSEAAQTGPAPRDTAEGATPIWDQVAANAERLLADPDLSKERLEELRSQVIAIRSEAADRQMRAQVEANELTKRISALGPAPAEGVQESAEIADRRALLEDEYRLAMVPVLQAQEVQERVATIVAEIDRRLLAKISQALLKHGPTPLLPRNWVFAARELGSHIQSFVTQTMAQLRVSVAAEHLLQRLPLNVFLAGIGVAIILVNRRYVGVWVETWLERARHPRSIAWALAMRNLTRIVIPLLGGGIIFSAFNPNTLLEQGSFADYFGVPPFVWYLIGAGWLSGSFFAPRSGAFRQLPLSDSEARIGALTTQAIGVVLALVSLLVSLSLHWKLADATNSVLFFPLAAAVSVCLWRLAGTIRIIRSRVEQMEHAAAPDSPGRIGQKFLELLTGFALLGAVVIPLLSIAGYFNASFYLSGVILMTFFIIGASLVVFDLLNKSVSLIVSSAGSDQDAESGFGPVIVGLVVIVGALHLLALAWGARPEDIAEIWRILREGMVVGGVRVSASGVLKFILVFSLLIALTHLVQALLRAIVLPRTRFDAGGRSAVLTGAGYVGKSLAVLAAVSAAGFDLTSIAIVFGALSVGIGFGLQNIVSNFISGIILLIERPIKEGDWIEVAGFAGYVKGVHVRSTEIATFDHASVIVPNSDLIAGTVLNRTHSDLSGRVAIPIGVGYGSDPRHVERVLIGIIEQHPLVLVEPAPSIVFIGFGADSMNFEIRCYLRDVNFSLTVKSDVNFDIVKRFREEGIEIPFPQRDLHIRSIEGLDKMLGEMKKDGGNS